MLQRKLDGPTSHIVLLVDVVLQGRESGKCEDEAKEGKCQPEYKQHCCNWPAKLASHSATCVRVSTGSLAWYFDGRICIERPSSGVTVHVHTRVSMQTASKSFPLARA